MALFDSLSSKLSSITAKMRGKARVTEQDIKLMMREIKLALLEADVNYLVVKELTSQISERCQGQEIFASLTPGQQVIKVVNECLVELLGTENSKLAVSPSGFTVIMLFGLQGSGKTTVAAKLALHLKKAGKKPFVVGCDVHRPAAAEQLAVLAKQVDVPCYIDPPESNAIVIANEAISRAKYLLCDTVIVDTAGRMTIDDAMMQELVEIQKAVKPTEKLLVVDAMIGQEAVNIAKTFEEMIGLDGFVMTKLDGDARGGAALSIKKLTGKPIKFIGTGEKVEALELFHPDRMASRILGMGDVLSLIEKAGATFTEDQQKQAEQLLHKKSFTLQDMHDQLEQVSKMGSIDDVLSMVPGMSKQKMPEGGVDPRILTRNLAIIRSMTKRERINAKLINGDRRKRIATGSGTSVQDVNRLLKQHEEMQKMMKRFSGMFKGRRKGLFG